MINELHTRDTMLIRPKVANVNQVVIVFALKDPMLNYDLLDRFIVLAEESDLDIILCLNKSDLVSEEEIQKFYSVYGDLYKIVTVSTVENRGIDEIKKLMYGKVTVFAGASGVGKSSITNKIVNREIMETGVVSKKIGRGRHTTRHSEFIPITNGDTTGYIVDTPGFTSLSFDHIDKQDLQIYYKEFRQYVGQCKFKNCVHINEPDCKVKENIGKTISEKRYNSYKYYYNE